MKCCEATAREISEEIKSEAWQRKKARMIAQHGKVLNLMEMKELAVKEGKTLFEKMQEYED